MIYEYECARCSHLWTEIRKVAERNDDASCPKCGGNGKPQISMFHWHFNRTHPDIKGDMMEHVTGNVPGNYSEL